MHAALALSVRLLLALQQQPPAEPAGYTTPPSRDTVGYWQQGVSYRILASLNEDRGVLTGEAELVYTNNSPDTLREFYIHQHLNAFRPGSKWSAVDEREGRVRFQDLVEPDYAYERFTAPPEFNGVAVRAEYPGSPDSTVAHFTLPRPLAPRDSMRVVFRWEARPSTLPRRQGRLGRSFDFAQWYPKVAVYDRGGWEPNPLVPAGEFYGEYGTYDVSLILRDDQVIGATGVPVSGDPGWQRVLRAGAVYNASRAYGTPPPLPAVQVPTGFKLVRFMAKGVHEFAWSTSPDYRYEGAFFVHRAPAPRVGFPVYDTVAVNVLYRPGDDTTWGRGLATGRTITALQWLESIYGPYGYPAFTNLHRIEGGGTEFPMMVMNGSASQGLILHEGGHNFTMGILGNNEWRSGWMDEGFTSYQTSWAQRLTPQDRPDTKPPARPAMFAYSGFDTVNPVPKDSSYRGRAVRPDATQAAQISEERIVHLGLAEPVGTAAYDFRDFNIYNDMIYNRAEMMYGHLRDILGDVTFRAFLQDYYTRWAFKHVDEQAMRASAERVSGKDLGWFFRQWVHEVGNLDYALTKVEIRPDGAGWLTRARVVRRGDFLHPIPVGVLSAVNAGGGLSGTSWTIGRAYPILPEQWVEIRTAQKPTQVILDPYRRTMDWDRRNDVAPLQRFGAAQIVFDWPLLSQSSSNRVIAALSPIVLQSQVGGLALGIRKRANYQGTLSRYESAVAVSLGAGGRTSPAGDAGQWLNAWWSVESPRLPFAKGPALGLKLAAWYVDDAFRADVNKRWDASPYTTGTEVLRSASLSYLRTHGLTYLSPSRWDDGMVTELSVGEERRFERADSLRGRLTLSGGVGNEVGIGPQAYARFEAEASARRVMAGGRTALSARLFVGGVTEETPTERRLHVATLDPMETFGNRSLRPSGTPLSRGDIHFATLGDGALRGYYVDLSSDNLAAANIDFARRVYTFGTGARSPAVWVSAFGDAALYLSKTQTGSAGRSLQSLADAGAGIALRGLIFDRDVKLRLDFPILVKRPALGVGTDPGDKAAAFRWTFSLADLW